MRRIRKILSVVLAFVLTFCGLGFQIPNVQAATNYITIGKTVNPTTITTLDEAEVALSIKAAPPVTVVMPNDVILIIDKSGSMLPNNNPGKEDKITAAKNAAKSFIDLMDMTKHRVGVVDYSSANLVNSFNLTTDAAAAKSYIDGIIANGSTDTGKAVEVATQMLANHRPEAQPVIVIMTDGAANVGPNGQSGEAIGFQYAKDAAKAAKEAGIVFYTIALLNTNDNPDTSAPNLVLKEMATTAQHHHFVLGSVGLDVIYRQIVQEIGRASAYNVTVTDVVTPEFEIVPGSADNNIPKPEINGNTLTWKFHELKDQELIFNYKIRHKEGAPIGVLPISSNSMVQYKDYAGADLSAAIPSCNLTVKYPAPIINTVTPQSGLITGGESVKIQGQYFMATPKVYFGTAEATVEQFVDATTIIVKAPPSSTVGAADVKVVNPDQQQAIKTDGYTYENPTPIINTITPQSGSTTGGESVKIQGQYFMATPKVYFGTAEATVEQFVDATTIIVKAPPASTVGAVDVKVVNPDQKQAIKTDGYTYEYPAPIINTITPQSGLITGGESVKIQGQYFRATPKVYFGAAEAAIEQFVDATTILVKAPPASTAGAVDVKVVNPDQKQAIKTDGYTYEYPAPIINTITPQSGLITGGESVKIQGQYFRATPKVYFGAAEAAIEQFVDATTILVKAPPASTAGAVDVKVINPDQKQAIKTNGYTYEYSAPTVTSISPNSGFVTGGNTVTIQGTMFFRETKIFFGAKEAGMAYYFGPTKVNVTVPSAEAPGAVDVKIVNPDGKEVVSPGAYTYIKLPAPTITKITPNSGLVTGGDIVVIEGTNFSSTTKVKFGDTELPLNKFYSSTKIQVVSPAAQSAGAVDVTVVNADAQSASVPGGFTYNELPPPPPPTITSLSPNSGLVTGGDTVTIQGSMLSKETKIYFGNKEAAIIYYFGATKVNVRVPAAETAGVVDVKVVNTDGQEATLPGSYTYIALPPPPPPTVTLIDPNTSLISGGVIAYISGSNLDRQAKVLFGGIEVPIHYYYSANKISVVVPAVNAPSVVDIKVTNPDGQSAELPAAFTYTAPPPPPAPTLTAITPNSYWVSGGITATITGTNFKGKESKVFVGENEAQVFYVYNTTKMDIKIPASSTAGTVDVKIVNPEGQSAILPAAFTYNEILPTITSVSPNSGLITGGDTVIIIGSNFTRDTKVFFGSIEVALAYYYSTGKISAVSPAVSAPQTVDISIVNPDGKSAVLANAFTYIPKPVEPAPTLNAISPNSGLVSGGNTATITGANFKGKTSKVYVGGVEATIFYVYNTMKIDIKVPASTTTGVKDVTIVNPDGQSHTLPGAYTYMPLPPEPAPVLSSLTPNSGSTAGGYYVTIQGANLKRTTKIYFGDTEVPINYYYGTTKVRVIAPAGSAGAVTVKAVNPDGQESLLVGGFTYTAP